jgi:hypothetical protein
MKQQILAQPASEDRKIAACSKQHAARSKGTEPDINAGDHCFLVGVLPIRD